MRHKADNCPKLKQPTTRRAFVMHAKQADPDTTLIIGQILLAGIATTYLTPKPSSLLDSGATHSFVYEFFVKKFGILPVDVESGFRLTVPSGEHMISSSVVNDVELRLQKNIIRADLIVLPMPEFDIIFGMDWLTLNLATIDFRRRPVSIRQPNGKAFIFEAAQNNQIRSIEDVEVVKEFPDVFSDDVSGIPPER
ncbi:uncharacterized protein LOC142505046 [Primulina tabacum]|uniref:uncharacterized protein LOC142505046 n=1 Tax=Primulina tabacum TaxID=48773 RepID=UPI003F59FBC6